MDKNTATTDIRSTLSSVYKAAESYREREPGRWSDAAVERLPRLRMLASAGHAAAQARPYGDRARSVQVAAQYLDAYDRGVEISEDDIRVGSQA